MIDDVREFGLLWFVLFSISCFGLFYCAVINLNVKLEELIKVLRLRQVILVSAGNVFAHGVD